MHGVRAADDALAAPGSAWTVALTAAVTGLLTLYIAKAILLATPFVTDDFIYHAPATAHWIQAGRLTLAPQGYHAYFPLLSELFTTWFRAPVSRGRVREPDQRRVDAAGGRRDRRDRRATPGFARGGTARRDVPAGRAGDPARVRIVRRDRRGGHGAGAGISAVRDAAARTAPRAAEVALAGVAIGLALGCRVRGRAAVRCSAIFVWTARARPGRRGRSGVLLFALAVAVAGGPWYVRNWLLTGNPVFPAALGPFDGPFDAASQDRTRLASRLMDSASGWPRDRRCCDRRPTGRCRSHCCAARVTWAGCSP